MRIGVQLSGEHTTVAALRSAWTYLDQLNVDSLWVEDHLLPTHGDADGGQLECWSLLSAIAATTRRLEIGPLVTCYAFRNPALLSAMARTVDDLSEGRLVLGFGAGWFRGDFDELGLPLGAGRERLAAMEKAVVAVRERWQRSASGRGRRIPILIGAGGERFGLPVAARHADIWNWFGPVEEFAAKNRVLTAWCSRIGRDPGEIERSAMLSRRSELSLLDDYAGAGANQIIFGLRDPWDWDAVHRLVEWACGQPLG